MDSTHGSVGGGGAGAHGQGEEDGDGSPGHGATTNFGGSQFVIQNEPHQPNPGPVNGSQGASFQSSASGMGARQTPHDYSAPELYCSQLLRQCRGFPLYVPGPQADLPAEYRRRGVAIGDVGRITPEGSFDFLFNIFLPASHPVNANAPNDFVPMSPYDPIDVLCLDYVPGDWISTPSVTIGNCTSEFPGEDFVFDCVGPSGALLCLPHGGRLQRLRNLNSLRYAAKHADHWYKYVNGIMGLRLANGDLHLVTGCEKAKSWGLVTFHDVPLGTNFQLSFRPTRGEAEGYKYRWQGSYGHWKHEDAPPDDGSPLNQTTFIHTFPVWADEGLWQKLLAFAVQQLANYPTILHQLGRFISVANPEPSFPRSLFFGNGAPVRGGHGIVTETFPVPKIFNPSQILYKCLFREVPHARVVIIHTDDWCDAMAELDQDGQQTPEEIAPELERIVFERHEIVEEDGLAYLRRKPDVTSSNAGQ